MLCPPARGPHNSEGAPLNQGSNGSANVESMPVMLESNLRGSPGGRIGYEDAEAATSVRPSDSSGAERARGGMNSDEHASVHTESKPLVGGAGG